jgi:hypothetical protein
MISSILGILLASLKVDEGPYNPAGLNDIQHQCVQIEEPICIM